MKILEKFGINFDEVKGLIELEWEVYQDVVITVKICNDEDSKGVKFVIPDTVDVNQIKSKIIKDFDISWNRVITKYDEELSAYIWIIYFDYSL